jgi:hypothetical protein
MTSENTEVSQSNISQVCKSIKNLRSHGRYRQAHAYISALDPRLSQIPAVAIEIASTYVTQGHYIRAWDSCQLPDSDIFMNAEPSQAFTPQIYDVDCVALALVKAYIGISRFARTSTALQVAERVYEVWLAENREYNDDF